MIRTLSRTFLATALTVGVFASAHAQTSPTDFVQNLANQTVNAFKQNPQARSGDITAIRQIVDQYVIPQTDFEKTTRLATGQPWRQATAEQKAQLVQAFQTKLVRTYSGAFKSITDKTVITVKPFTGDPNAKDVIVHTSIDGASSQPVAMDYRLEKSGDSWKIYDFNVEGIWLIQNYRNQFSSQISKGGIDGLIKALQGEQ